MMLVGRLCAKRIDRGLCQQVPEEKKTPANCCIQSLVWKWCQTVSVANMKKSRPPLVRAPEAVCDILENQLEDKSVYHKRRVLKSPNLKPYRIMCAGTERTQKAKGVNNRTWLMTMIADGHLDLLLYFMTNEAWFHSSGHVNPQNMRYWSTEYSHLTHETPFNDQKIGVWCVVSGTQTVGPNFFE